MKQQLSKGAKLGCQDTWVCIRLKIENSWWNRKGHTVQIWLTTNHSSFFFPTQKRPSECVVPGEWAKCNDGRAQAPPSLVPGLLPLLRRGLQSCCPPLPFQSAGCRTSPPKTWRWSVDCHSSIPGPSTRRRCSVEGPAPPPPSRKQRWSIQPWRTRATLSPAVSPSPLPPCRRSVPASGAPAPSLPLGCPLWGLVGAFARGLTVFRRRRRSRIGEQSVPRQHDDPKSEGRIAHSFTPATQTDGVVVGGGAFLLHTCRPWGVCVGLSKPGAAPNSPAFTSADSLVLQRRDVQIARFLGASAGSNKQLFFFRECGQEAMMESSLFRPQNGPGTFTVTRVDYCIPWAMLPQPPRGRGAFAPRLWLLEASRPQLPQLCVPARPLPRSHPVTQRSPPPAPS